MLAAYDVIDFVQIAGIVFVKEAILTAIMRATSHDCASLRANVTSHERGFREPWPWLAQDRDGHVPAGRAQARSCQIGLPQQRGVRS